MRLMILGKHSDDRGAQLEALTKEILESLNYRRIGMNRAGIAGELDITGEHVIPMPVQDKVERLLGECKAHKEPLNMTDWLKFLGKIYIKQASGETVNGCLIALSGVNGVVQESYG